MIIKKPYAFLIKHFRIIHILLLIPTIYLMFKFNDLASFFRNYADVGNKTLELTIAGSYITKFTYVALFFMLISNLTIFLLMKSKKKPTIYYGLNILYYIYLTIISIVFYLIISELETRTLDATIVNFIRDIAGLTVIPLYAIIAVTITKGIGFNFKSFRFERNGDLQITDEDDEEVELKLGNGSFNTKKTAVHTLRELKYYVLENKFVFTCIGFFLAFIIVISLYMNYQVYNKRYNSNQAFALDNFTMTLKESYITDVDYSGRIINKDNYYLVVKLAIYNKSNKAVSIDKSNFRVYFDNKYLFPNYDRSNRFIDVGKPYQGELIYEKASDDYVLVYEIDESMIRSEYKMKILSGLKHEPDKLIPSYKIISIKPNNITEIEDLGEAKVNTPINFEHTMLGNTKLKIKGFRIDDSYSYNYSYCVTQDECYTAKNTLLPSTGKALAIIEDEITWDEASSYYKNGNKDLYGDFANISYRYNTGITLKRYNDLMKDVTPANVKNVKIYEVPKMVSSSAVDDISLKIIIRNKVITIHV